MHAACRTSACAFAKTRPQKQAVFPPKPTILCCSSWLLSRLSSRSCSRREAFSAAADSPSAAAASAVRSWDTTAASRPSTRASRLSRFVTCVYERECEGNQERSDGSQSEHTCICSPCLRQTPAALFPSAKPAVLQLPTKQTVQRKPQSNPPHLAARPRTCVRLAASCCCSRTNCSSAAAVAAALAGPDSAPAAAAAAADSAARTRSSSCSICRTMPTVWTTHGGGRQEEEAGRQAGRQTGRE
jgi:hypothetical protein